MKKIIYLIFIFGLFITISCDRKSNKNESWKEEYLKLFKPYSSEMVNCFPNEESINPNYSSYVSYPSIYAPSQLIITQKESKKTIDSLISISKKISYSDSSYYIVNKYLREDNTLSIHKNYSKFKEQTYVKNAIPLPNFYKLEGFSENTFHHLGMDYTIYSVDTKAIKCCSDKQHDGQWHMPKEMEDGYSRGYAINSENGIVVYWLVVW